MDVQPAPRTPRGTGRSSRPPEKAPCSITIVRPALAWPPCRRRHRRAPMPANARAAASACCLLVMPARPPARLASASVSLASRWSPWSAVVDLLHGRRARMVFEVDQDREVVRAEGGQALQAVQQEVRAVEHVVERPAQPAVVGVEAVVEAAADARVDQAAQAAEQAAGARPGDVVEVARHDHRLGLPGDLAPDQHQLGVARQRAVGLGRARRLGVDADQHDVLARAQAHAGADRRDALAQQEAQLGVEQLQPREQGQAVGVVERVQDPVACGRGAWPPAGRPTRRRSPAPGRGRGRSRRGCRARPSTSRLVISTLTTTRRRLRAGWLRVALPWRRHKGV